MYFKNPLEDDIIFLNVPYSERNKVKRLGAKWEPFAKKWYIPRTDELEVFTKWLPKKFMVLAVAPVYIIESSKICWKCNNIVQVITLSSEKVIQNEEDLNKNIESLTGPLVIYSSISYIPISLAKLIEEQYPTYFKDYSRTKSRRT